MKGWILCFFFVFCLCGISNGAFEFKTRGARSAAVGGAYTAVSDDAEGVWWNPAGAGFAESIQMQASYTSLFGISELALKDFSAVFPLSDSAALGAGFSSFGFSDYTETDIRLLFSAAIAEGVYAGASAKKNSVTLDSGSESAEVFSVDAGLIATVSRNCRLGLSLYNINRPLIASSPNEYLNQRYMVGFYAFLFDEVHLSVDLHKSAGDDWQHRLGAEFPVADNFSLRCGIQSRPGRFSMGFNLTRGMLSFDYAFINHSVLGGQHLFALGVSFGGRDSGCGINNHH